MTRQAERRVNRCATVAPSWPSRCHLTNRSGGGSAAWFTLDSRHGVVGGTQARSLAARRLPSVPRLVRREAGDPRTTLSRRRGGDAASSRRAAAGAGSRAGSGRGRRRSSYTLERGRGREDLTRVDRVVDRVSAPLEPAAVVDGDPWPFHEVRVEPGLARPPAGAAIEGDPLLGRDAGLRPVRGDLRVGAHRVVDGAVVLHVVGVTPA